MKVSEFMLQLAKKLIDDRKIAESTATQYLQTLHKLNGGKPFNNLAWAKKYDTVQAVLIVMLLQHKATNIWCFPLLYPSLTIKLLIKVLTITGVIR